MISYESTLAAAAKCALLSFDATMRSNLSVAPPIDLLCYPANSLRAEVRNSIADDAAYFAKLRAGYGQGILELFKRLPIPTGSDRTIDHAPLPPGSAATLTVSPRLLHDLTDCIPAPL